MRARPALSGAPRAPRLSDRDAQVSKRSSRGQSLVEATLVLLVFFALLLGVVDCGQVLWSHQALQERVRSAVRWGTMHPYDGTGSQIANLVLYGQPSEPP